jgi:lysophospholipase L1-like esterase
MPDAPTRERSCPARRRATLAAVAAAVLAAGLGVGEPSRAASYVALGDSYSSGLGTRDYDEQSAGCRRGPHAYPLRVATRLGIGLRHVACSGATVATVAEGQLRYLAPHTALVTISVGGNDAGFARILRRCARPWPLSCVPDIDAAEALIARELPERLGALYHRIARRAQGAKVAVVGYPRLFEVRRCARAGFVDLLEQRRLNGAAELLAQVTRARVRAHGFRYVDPTPAFAGRGVCGRGSAWINGLALPIAESFHPNRIGHGTYGRLVLAALR